MPILAQFRSIFAPKVFLLQSSANPGPTQAEKSVQFHDILSSVSLDILYTPRAREASAGSVIGDGLEDDGCSGTTGKVCGSGVAPRAVLEQFVPGVWDSAPDGAALAGALSRWRSGGDRRTQPAAAALAAADRAGVGTEGGELRLRYPDWGARKLQVLLGQDGIRLPASTIHRILLRHALVPENDRHRPAPQRFERATPNELWQMDFKGPKSWHQPVGPLSVLDDHSRYVIALEALGSTHAGPVRERLERHFPSAVCRKPC